MLEFISPQNNYRHLILQPHFQLTSAHPPMNSWSSSTSGIWKSTDGGTTWTKKTSNIWIDMEFKPGDPNIICASSVGYASSLINRSADNGDTWAYYTVASGGYRSELAVTANNSSIVYMLSCNNSGGLNGVYKSTNSGTSFTRVDDGTKSMLYYYSDGSGSNVGQGTYDLCIAASPSDANTVYIGGINNWKTTNGGTTWLINNMWTSHPYYNYSGAPEVHADKHALAFQNSTTLFEGNDGGIYKTTNGGTNWTDLTNGIVISQIYRIGISQTDANVVLTGLQDNGSKKYTGGLSSWVDVYGGDGMECIVDFNNTTSYMYVTYVNGEIQRNTDGFSSYYTTQISANIPGGQPTGAWVTPYIMNPTNAAILYAGYDKVWKTTNRGDSWTSASQVLSATAKLRSLAIAPSNTNVLYAAAQTNMWKTTDGGATNWSAITLPTASINVTYIAVKNNDPNTVWITYGGYTTGSKVYESTNGGTSWTNISTGLPNLPLMNIVQYKVATDRNVLFVGTDVGVYVKDGSASWASFNTGLPNVVVTELEIYYGGSVNKLRAGTYGRGLWETDIDAALPFAPAFSVSPTNLSYGNVLVGSSKQDSVTVTNTGTATLTITSVTSNNAEVTVTPTSGSLAPSASQKFYITFSPTSTGAKSGDIIFTHDASGSPDTVTVNGTGTAPVFLVSTTTINYGSVLVGLSKQDSVTVTNTGTGTLTILSVTSNDTNFIVLPTSGSIPASGSQKFYVSFTPSSMGVKSGNIILSHNAAGSPDTVTVIGTGYSLMTIPVHYNYRWNMVSVPLDVPDYRKDSLFPTAISQASAYQHGYVTSTVLTNGAGYWLKFGGAQYVGFEGISCSVDTIDVETGWNLIGSISSPIAVSTITSIPGGLVTSNAFGYNSGYQRVDSIKPGYGYWMKVSSAGQLILSSPSALHKGGTPADRIRIVPTSEMPPPPPDRSITKKEEIPESYALMQNYPNPFNPVTEIHYQLPVDNYVTLKVYYVLGKEIVTLVNGMQTAGYKSVSFDATNIPSGMYFYRLTSGTFTDVKKMLLVK
jgi:photosystem II stability/assembly factor-like uncharacterized protein